VSASIPKSARKGHYFQGFSTFAEKPLLREDSYVSELQR
jgi:hypothetical protein